MIRKALGHVISCREVSRLLSRSSGRGHPLVAAVALRAHLAICDACTASNGSCDSCATAMRKYVAVTRSPTRRRHMVNGASCLTRARAPPSRRARRASRLRPRRQAHRRRAQRRRSCRRSRLRRHAARGRRRAGDRRRGRRRLTGALKCCHERSAHSRRRRHRRSAARSPAAPIVRACWSAPASTATSARLARQSSPPAPRSSRSRSAAPTSARTRTRRRCSMRCRRPNSPTCRTPRAATRPTTRCARCGSRASCSTATRW